MCPRHLNLCGRSVSYLSEDVAAEVADRTEADDGRSELAVRVFPAIGFASDVACAVDFTAGESTQVEFLFESFKS